jgi:hypothetical protein
LIVAIFHGFLAMLCQWFDSMGIRAGNVSIHSKVQTMVLGTVRTVDSCLVDFKSVKTGAADGSWSLQLHNCCWKFKGAFGAVNGSIQSKVQQLILRTIRLLNSC